MNDMHMHCVSCKKDQWLPEDCPHCSYCGSRMLWEIVEPLTEVVADLHELADVHGARRKQAAQDHGATALAGQFDHFMMKLR